MSKVWVIAEDCKNIVIGDNCFENVRLTDFLLTLTVDCNFDEVNSSDVYFLLDDSVENNFNFSFEKDYETREIRLVIKGGVKQNFKLKSIGIKGELL